VEDWNPSCCSSRNEAAAQADEQSGRSQRVDRPAETDRRPPKGQGPRTVEPHRARTRPPSAAAAGPPRRGDIQRGPHATAARRHRGIRAIARVPVTLRAGGVEPSGGGGIPCSGPCSEPARGLAARSTLGCFDCGRTVRWLRRWGLCVACGCGVPFLRWGFNTGA
jgi:hypothetical protein